MTRAFFGRPMEILLVEDSLADAHMTTEGLKTSHFRHRVTLICDGEEALKFLRHEEWFAKAPLPDLILLDLNLPRLDGRELLAELRSDPELSRIPVVVLTSSGDHEEMIREEHLQVEDYLTKPVDMGQFVDLVRRLKSFWHADVILPQTN